MREESTQEEQWIAVMDKITCKDCVRLHNRIESKTYWDRTGRPGERQTECDGSCRCGLFLTGVFDLDIQKKIDKAIDKAVDEMFGRGIKVDMRKGGKLEPVILNKYEQIKGIYTVSYERIAFMEDLIYQWKVENGGIKLPNEFFKLNDIDLQIKWLERNVTS